MKESGLNWCLCHNMVREGGMCSYSGFCHPEPLYEDIKQDLVLIQSYQKENQLEITETPPEFSDTKIGDGN